MVKSYKLQVGQVACHLQLTAANSHNGQQCPMSDLQVASAGQRQRTPGRAGGASTHMHMQLLDAQASVGGSMLQVGAASSHLQLTTGCKPVLAGIFTRYRSKVANVGASSLCKRIRAILPNPFNLEVHKIYNA